MKKIFIGILVIFVLSCLFVCDSRSPISGDDVLCKYDVFCKIEPNILLINQSEKDQTWNSEIASEMAEPIKVALSSLPLEVRGLVCSKKPLIIIPNPHLFFDPATKGRFVFGRYYWGLNKIELFPMEADKSDYVSNFSLDTSNSLFPSPFWIILHEFGHALDANNHQFICEQFPNYEVEKFADAFAAYVLCPEKLDKCAYEWLQENIFKAEPDRQILWEWLRGID